MQTTRKVYLNANLSHEIQRYLKSKDSNYQIDENRRQFDLADIEKIEKINFNAEDSVSYLKYFKNLKEINVLNEMISINVNKESILKREPNFFDRHITDLAKYCPNLESLDIVSVESIQHLNKFKQIKQLNIENMLGLDTDKLNEVGSLLPNLEGIYIKDCDELEAIQFNNENFNHLNSICVVSNKNLTKISGIKELKEIRELEISGNENLNKTSMYFITQFVANRMRQLKTEGSYIGLRDFILDARMFPYMRSLNLDEYTKSRLLWSERYADIGIYEKYGVDSNPRYIKYTTKQMEKADDVANKIIGNLIGQTDTPEEKFAILYSYIKNNVEYNFADLDKVSQTQYGKTHTNGLVQGLLEGRCVCEGYSRMLQYLLDKCGISSQLVACIHCLSEEQRKRLMESKIRCEENHSMIIPDLPIGKYVCDPTFEAGEYQGKYPKNTYFAMDAKYALLTLEQMDKAHQDEGFDEKMNVSSENYGVFLNGDYEISTEPLEISYINELMENARKRIKERNPVSQDYIPTRKSGKKDKSESILDNAIEASEQYIRTAKINEQASIIKDRQKQIMQEKNANIKPDFQNREQ